MTARDKNICLMKKVFIIFVFSILMSSPICAQLSKQTAHLNQIWAAYFNQTRFTNKWGAWVDLHVRTKEDFATNLSQSIVRLGLTLYLNDQTKLTAGYAFINHFPADNHKNISVPEHRPWQQIQWHTRYSKIRTMQWIRLEERLRQKVENNDRLAHGYNFNYRLRYNILISLPLSKKGVAAGGWSFILNDEIHINFGKEIVYNYFDQNRFFSGFAYHTNAHDNIQIGYMNLFQQLQTGNRYRNIHALRIFYFHNLDIRKNKVR